MDYFSPAFWAAIAAICSASAAIGNWLQQRQNFLNSIRPILSLSDWAIQHLESSVSSTITIGSITNYGQGPAVYIRGSLQASKSNDTAHLFCSYIATILPPKEKQIIECKGTFNWSAGYGPNVQNKINNLIALRLSIYYEDLYGNKYESRFDLIAKRKVNSVAVAVHGEELAPDLYLCKHNTYIKSKMRLRREACIKWIRQYIKTLINSV